MQIRPRTAGLAVSATLAAALVALGVYTPGAAAAPAGGNASGGATTTQQAITANNHTPRNTHPDAGAQVAAVGLSAVLQASGIDNYTWINLYWNGVYAGQVVWSENPDNYDFDGNGNQDPGDAIIAFDDTADGLGVEARLSTGRIASTRGHNSPYSSGWKGGDLPENHSYGLRGCLVQGDWEACTDSVGVQS